MSRLKEDASVGSYTIQIASVDQVDSVWKFVVDGFREGSERCGGEVDPQHLWHMCRNGSAFLIVAIRPDQRIAGAGVWKFENWLTGKKFRCHALYGYDMKEWYGQYRSFIEEQARIGGANALVTDGRKGWERIEPRARVLRQLYEVEL